MACTNCPPSRCPSNNSVKIQREYLSFLECLSTSRAATLVVVIDGFSPVKCFSDNFSKDNSAMQGPPTPVDLCVDIMVRPQSISCRTIMSCVRGKNSMAIFYSGSLSVHRYEYTLTHGGIRNRPCQPNLVLLQGLHSLRSY